MSDPFTNLIDKMDDPQIAIITLSKNTHHSSIIFFILKKSRASRKFILNVMTYGLFS